MIRFIPGSLAVNHDTNKGEKKYCYRGAQGWEIDGFCVTLDGAPYLHGRHRVLVPLSLIPLAVFKAF